ncbi:alginate O-acetyltransferase AlgX-related protein [Stenotrophomonas sp. LGBM10]|uniref:alginate O-acetyltransferase AlgX-related protein n=1 Tax=Stenotrophomonas sp. LGBM10 TaxID=3390038 RepID=UPI00398B187D
MKTDAPVSRRPSRLRLPLLVALCALACSGPVLAQAPAPTPPVSDDSSIVLVGKDGWLFPAWGSLSDVDTKAVDASTALIAEAKAALAARGIRLEPLVLPDKVIFYEDRLPEGKVVSPSVEKRYDTILASLKRAGIDALDAKQVLSGVRASGADVFYRSDQHWTQVAADATADAMAARIKAAVPTLAGEPGSGMALGREVRERRYGDLAELFLPPDQRAAIGRETFVVRRAAEGQSLLDDGKAPVHVTGHSMVQAYFGFPQKLSNSLDRPVTVNWKAGNVGPWVMLLEYLESADFRDNPPQVLVWQMFEPVYGFGPQAQGQWDNASIMTPQQWQARLHKALGQ